MSSGPIPQNVLQDQKRIEETASAQRSHREQGGPSPVATYAVVLPRYLGTTGLRITFLALFFNEYLPAIEITPRDTVDPVRGDANRRDRIEAALAHRI